MHPINNLVHRKLFLPFFLLALILLSYEICAANPPESDAFQAGITAFKQKNYESALNFFKQAKSLGLDKPSLYYNIGVCCYKLGLYDEAAEAFHKTATFPKMAPLAYYNLGVVAAKQDKQDKAITWLKKAYNQAEADDINLRVLAANALAKIEGKKGYSPWAGYVSFGLGYDDNVELVPDSDFLQASNMDDSFLDAYLFVRRFFAGKSTSSGSYLQSSLSYLKYADLNEYDTGTVDLAYYYWKQAGDYQLEGGGGYYYSTLDGHSYEQSPMVSLQVKHPLGTLMDLRLRYRVNYFDVLDSDYEYLSGWRHQTMAEVSKRWGNYFAYLAYTLELNDRDDDDYSPTRHQFGAGADMRLLENIGVNLYLGYRNSDYSIESYEDRHEDRFDAILNLTYYLTTGWEITCKLEHTNNESNDDSYDYTRNAATLYFAHPF